MALRVWEVDWLLLDQLVHLRVVVVARVEGREAHDHLVGQDTHGPPVHWEGVSFFVQDLWRQVVWRSTEGVSLVASVQNLGKTKVGQADVAILVHQDVLWL